MMTQLQRVMISVWQLQPSRAPASPLLLLSVTTPTGSVTTARSTRSDPSSVPPLVCFPQEEEPTVKVHSLEDDSGSGEFYITSSKEVLFVAEIFGRRSFDQLLSLGNGAYHLRGIIV